MVLLGYFLGTQMLFHCDWIVRSPFDGSIVGNNDTFDSRKKKQKDMQKIIYLFGPLEVVSPKTQTPKSEIIREL